MLGVTRATRGRLRRIARQVFRRFFPQPTAADWLKRCGLPDNAYFVQVGSNDGVTGDPLRDLALDRGWRGLLIEPVPFIFKRLQANCGGNPKFSLANVAIDQTAGVRPFFYLDETTAITKRLPIWYDQIGSFDKSHIIKHFGPEIEPHICVAEVQCRPLMEVIADHDVDRCDLLHIDTEGYDYKILSQFDFEKLRPKVILYEHVHLPEHEKQAAIDLVSRHGYRAKLIGRDCLCITYDSERFDTHAAA